MQRLSIAKFIGGVITASILVFAFYQLPPIHQRLSWRMDFAMTYLRGVIHPAGPMPTARPPSTAAALVSITPTLPHQTRTPTSTGMPSQPTDTQAPPTPSPTPIPGSVRLDPPKYEKQGINNCGPTTLAFYLRYYGWDGDQNTIATVVKPQPDDRNVNVEELAYYVHTKVGWLNMEYRVGMKLDDLKHLMAAGIPVMIEEGMHLDQSYWPNDDLWAGHYLFITGYDDATKSFTSQDSYYGPNLPVPYATLDRNWETFNRVLLLVYRPEQADTVKSILGTNWDVDANRQNALAEAQAEAQANPKDAYASFNVGTNLVYFERYTEAALAYDTARSLGLYERMLRYQFGPFLAYFHSGRNDDLKALTEYALQRTPNSEEAMLWDGWALYRSGDKAGAESEFRKALGAHPNYQDAIYALNFLGTN